MPTYGYECLSCDNQFETFQSIKDDPLTLCESCSGKLRKRIYPVGISFKGSGFYVNDYAPKASGGSEPAKAEAAASGGEAKTDAKTETKTETKVDAKSETAKTETKSEPKVPAASAS